MVGIYLSGTGNTEHCIKKLLFQLNKEAKAISIEDASAISEVKGNTYIVLAYPIQYSNAPRMVRDFIIDNPKLWKGKRVLCVATMGAFSGDGAGCTARLLKRYGATILGGLHIKMPDSVCDINLLKKTSSEKIAIIQAADRKITSTAKQIKKGHYPKEGLNLFYHIAGLFGQRLWFYRKTSRYSSQLKISGNCIGCGTCIAICPMENLVLQGGRPIPTNRCTMCYRCISSCPQKAITLLGDKVTDQYRIEKYV